LLPHGLLEAVTSHYFLFFALELTLLFNFSYLIFNILFKCRYDLFKPRQLLLNGSICIRNVFDHNSFNFLHFGPLIVEFSFDVLLPTKDGCLNVVNHFLQLLVLVCKQSLLVAQRDQVLLFRPFDNIIHRHQSFLNLCHHSLLSLQ
jgi:hypothetical protein